MKKKKHLKFLKQLVENALADGLRGPAAALVRERLADVADEVATDTMGSGARGTRGRDAGAPSLMLAAHMDEIGLMVTYISDGASSPWPLWAAWTRPSCPACGSTCTPLPAPSMRHRGPQAHPPHQADEAQDGDAALLPRYRFGHEAQAREEACAGGRPHHVRRRIRAVRRRRMAVSKCFDDKCGVWIACRVMEEAGPRRPRPGRLHRGGHHSGGDRHPRAMTSAHAVNPDVALAFDVTHATDYPGIDKTKYGKIVCGAGPVIARGPNINPVVFSALWPLPRRRAFRTSWRPSRRSPAPTPGPSR